MIGEGGFGRVYKGFLTSLNQVPFSISLKSSYMRVAHGIGEQAVFG